MIVHNKSTKTSLSNQRMVDTADFVWQDAGSGFRIVKSPAKEQEGHILDYRGLGMAISSALDIFLHNLKVSQRVTKGT